MDSAAADSAAAWGAPPRAAAWGATPKEMTRNTPPTCLSNPDASYDTGCENLTSGSPRDPIKLEKSIQNPSASAQRESKRPWASKRNASGSRRKVAGFERVLRKDAAG